MGGVRQPRLLYLKGSVEQVVARCREAAGPELQAMDLDIDAIHRQVDEMTATGLRVLAFARADLDADCSSISHQDVAGRPHFSGATGHDRPAQAGGR